MVRLSRNSRPQTQIGIRMGICMLWRQGFIPCHGGYPIMELNVKLRCGGVAFRHAKESASRRRSFLSDFVFYGIVVRRKVFL